MNQQFKELPLCSLMPDDIKKALLLGLITGGTEPYYNNTIKGISFEIYNDMKYIHYFSSYGDSWFYIPLVKETNLSMQINKLIRMEDLTTPIYSKVGKVLENILKKNK